MKLEGFYFHCQSCDELLDEFQQTMGLCTKCKSIVSNSARQYSIEMAPYDIHRMWHPPMGGTDEFFQDVENEYTGGSSSE